MLHLILYIPNKFENLCLLLKAIKQHGIVESHKRNSIQKNNVPEMSLDEINAEIAAVRAGK